MEESAGCIIVKHFNGIPHVLLAHAAGNWNNKLMGFPKGHVEKGESLKRTAIRETKEEVGITPDIVDYLGSSRTNKRKKVHAFIAFMKKGKLDGKKPINLDKNEIDYAKFYPLNEAESKVYIYQRPLFKKAIEYVNREGIN